MRLNISTKLFAGFGILLLLTAAMGWVSISRMGSLDQAAQRIFEEDLEAIVSITKIEEEALQVEELMTKGVLAALMGAEIHATDPVHAEELEAQADHLLEEAHVESEDVTLRLEALLASGLLHGELAAIAAEAQHNWSIFL
jgi:CHASE3 domain sensor protein